MVETTLKHMDDDTTLIIMSDHGFTSWRRSFHLNTWLKEKGYLVVKDPNMENDPGMFINIDWSQTQAYGVGINGLYINVRGRERNGIVSPERRKKIIDAISEDLLAEIDPVTGLQAVTKVYKRDEFYEDSKELKIGPDIIVGYAKGTRCSGHSALGGVGTKVFTNNTDEWSGDHEMDHRTVPGVLLTSRKLKKPAPRIQDLAASILAEFNINEPVQLQ